MPTMYAVLNLHDFENVLIYLGGEVERSVAYSIAPAK